LPERGGGDDGALSPVEEMNTESLEILILEREMGRGYLPFYVNFDIFCPFVQNHNLILQIHEKKIVVSKFLKPNKIQLTELSKLFAATPKPAPRRENRISNPGYTSKPPIILPPPKEQKTLEKQEKLPSKPTISKNSPSTPQKIEFRPPKSLPTDQGSVISNSVAGTGYSGLSSTLTLPRRSGFDGINGINGINGMNQKISKTDGNLGNLPETASVPSKGKLHASTNSIASSTKPVINLSQYPQMGELANSLKDLKLSRQQWIDLFQEHNILDLLKKTAERSKTES
jgi:hypothetical protein